MTRRQRAAHDALGQPIDPEVIYVAITSFLASDTFTGIGTGTFAAETIPT